MFKFFIWHFIFNFSIQMVYNIAVILPRFIPSRNVLVVCNIIGFFNNQCNFIVSYCPRSDCKIDLNLHEILNKSDDKTVMWYLLTSELGVVDEIVVWIFWADTPTAGQNNVGYHTGSLALVSFPNSGPIPEDLPLSKRTCWLWLWTNEQSKLIVSSN